MARPAPLRSPRLVCLALLTAHCWLGTGTVIDDYVKDARRRNVNSSSELLASLRRELMDNNYDYMSDSESEQFPSTSRHEQQAPRAAPDTAYPPAPDTAHPLAPDTAHPPAPDTAHPPAPDSAPPPAPYTAPPPAPYNAPPPAPPPAPYTAPPPAPYTAPPPAPYTAPPPAPYTAPPPARAAAPTLQPFVNDIYMPTDRPPLPSDSSVAADSAESLRALDKNDLLYYMDDAHLNRRAGDDLEPLHATDRADTTTPTLKYKVLKMKPPRGSRRAGTRGGYRRFLQEEGAGGVAIINLGDEPFPEFRLPSARRQYMSEEVMLAGRPSSELEGTLPSDLDGDPLTRPPLN